MNREQATATIYMGDDTWHSGPGFYWIADEYPEEGSVGAFKTFEEAVASAAASELVVGHEWPPIYGSSKAELRDRSRAILDDLDREIERDLKELDEGLEADDEDGLLEESVLEEPMLDMLAHRIGGDHARHLTRLEVVAFPPQVVPQRIGLDYAHPAEDVGGIFDQEMVEEAHRELDALHGSEFHFVDIDGVDEPLPLTITPKKGVDLYQQLGRWLVSIGAMPEPPAGLHPGSAGGAPPAAFHQVASAWNSDSSETPNGRQQPPLQEKKMTTNEENKQPPTVSTTSFVEYRFIDARLPLPANYIPVEQQEELAAGVAVALEDSLSIATHRKKTSLRTILVESFEERSGPYQGHRFVEPDMILPGFEAVLFEGHHAHWESVIETDLARTVGRMRTSERQLLVMAPIDIDDWVFEGAAVGLSLAAPFPSGMVAAYPDLAAVGASAGRANIPDMRNMIIEALQLSPAQLDDLAKLGTEVLAQANDEVQKPWQFLGKVMETSFAADILDLSPLMKELDRHAAKGVEMIVSFIQKTHRILNKDQREKLSNPKKFLSDLPLQSMYTQLIGIGFSSLGGHAPGCPNIGKPPSEWNKPPAGTSDAERRLRREVEEQSMLAAIYRSCALSGEQPRAAEVELESVRELLDARLRRGDAAPSSEDDDQDEESEEPTIQ